MSEVLILSLIRRITKSSKANQSVRFFVTARKENDIERSLSSVIRLNIKAHHVENNINFMLKRKRFNSEIDFLLVL